MKILHYVDENNLVWSQPWLQLINYLEGRGLQNHILCRPGGTLSGYVRKKDISLSTYKPLIPSLPHVCLGIPAMIRKIRPDLIHTRLSSAAMIGGYWGRRLNVPVVSTIDKYPKKKYYLNSDKLIPCSTAVADHMKSQGFAESAMELIYNPVDIAVYRKDFIHREKFRRQHDIAPDDFIILGAGRFVDWKGFDTLIKACSLLGATGNVKRNWNLWLVGDGPEMQNYKKCVSDFNLQKKTVFWGFQDDIKQFLWAADLFVQPSRAPEGFSLMLLEAMAAGLPAVASAIGGTPDIIDDGYSGWLFEPEDIETLATILYNLLSEENLQNFATRARLKAEGYSVEKIGEQTIRFYESFIDDKRRY